MPDTIVALATPAGRSGIGVIRLSGSTSLRYTRTLTGDPEFNPTPRLSTLRNLADLDTGEVIDEALITYFQGPNSFTGEDVIEISCHGSPVLLRLVIDSCLKLGARMAEAGEFSLRALANGRMNLAQAEAIRDLIDAQTAASARQAVRQMRGAFSNSLQPIKDDLLNAIVVLESALEFVEDDLPETQTSHLRSKLVEIAGQIGDLASTFEAGRLLRDGLKVTLAGKPNVGKSSIFNALLGSDRAIVTEIAGTTRDHINESVVIEGIPVSLMDTAGLRETSDTVESIGVERSRMAVADADLVVVVVDASQALSQEDEDILHSVESVPHIVAVNKVDKVEPTELDAVKRQLLNEGSRDLIIAAISAKTGEGIGDFKSAMVRPFLSKDTADSGFLVTDARHFDLLLRSQDEVLSSIELLDQKSSEEITLIGLHNALRYLGQITGETTTEDMLTRIFATFCIGK